VIPPDRQQLIMKLNYNYETTLLSFLASWLASWLSPKVIKKTRQHEHHCIDWRCVWWVCCSAAKHIRDIHWRLMPTRFSDICLTANQITNKHCLLCCGLVFKQIVDSLCLSIFRYTAAINFSWQFVQTVSTKHLILIAKLLLAFVESIIRVINFCQEMPFRVINLMNFESTDVFRIKMALKCAQNHGNLLMRRFEDVCL